MARMAARIVSRSSQSSRRAGASGAARNVSWSIQRVAPHFSKCLQFSIWSPRLTDSGSGTARCGVPVSTSSQSEPARQMAMSDAVSTSLKAMTYSCCS